MKKPLSIALGIGLLVSSTALAQFTQNYGGWLGTPSYGSMYPGMYNQAGMFPVAGAQNFMDPLLSQQLGSGQTLLNQCAYGQNQIIDPVEKEPEVIDARDRVDELKDSYEDARDHYRDARDKFQPARSKLARALSGMSPETFLDVAVKCEGYVDTLKGFAADAVQNDCASVQMGSADDTKSKPACVSTAWVKKAKADSTLGSDTTKAMCLASSANTRDLDSSGKLIGGNFDVFKLCIEKDTPIGNPAVLTAKKVVNPSAVGDCRNAARDAFQAYKDMKAAEDAYKKAQEEKSAASKELARAKRDAQRRLDREAREDAEDGNTASTAGIRYCAGCAAGTASVQKASPSKLSLILGAGLIGGISTLSILEQRAIANQNARLGFVTPPYLANTGAMITNGLSSGLNAGAPFLMNGLYGQTPGGYAQGGYGCAPTLYGSQMGNPYGPFAGGPYNGMYSPGGMYMPGMGPWGVNGYPGMMPGMMGMNPMMMGMNPMMMQQMAMMNQQYMDQMRAQQIAMYSIGYGLNAANQQYSYAQQILSGGMYGGMGGMNPMMGMSGMNPMMGMQPGYLMGGQNYGLNSYLNGTFTGGFTQQACGNPFSTISVCGSLPLGGSSYPTYTNGAYPSGPFGPGAAFGSGAFGSGGFGSGGIFNIGGYHR